uniref:uncharacterized protein LOC117610596 n=1 Tax=Osmia lignaria TaxID=473952 RepID=UPI0014794AC7|nr:uncharacterized protein LOC117610596 [Osmia lignaria]XP_034194062.1 uncharacterized protein LOC117610596 [Osmia lignaria]
MANKKRTNQTFPGRRRLSLKRTYRKLRQKQWQSSASTIEPTAVFKERNSLPGKRCVSKNVKEVGQTDMSDPLLVCKYHNNDPSFISNDPKDAGRISSENALRKNDETVVQCECTSDRYTVQNVLDNSDNNLVVDVGHVDVGRISENVPEGRRIVDVQFFWNEIHRTFDNHARGIECHFRDWKMIGSCQHGCLTQFFFKCQMCNYEDTVWSEPMHSDIMNVNEAMTTATVTVGIGYAKLEELCAALNMPCMAETAYLRYREKLVDEFMKSAIHIQLLLYFTGYFDAILTSICNVIGP